MTTDFKQILEPCLENVGRDVEVLLDAAMSFELADTAYGKTSALELFQGQTLQLATSVRSDEAASPVGFLVPEVAAIDLASTLLMTQGEVDQFNEEIAAAYDEVLNVIFNGWKLAAPTPDDRVVSSPKQRDVEAYTADGLDEYLELNQLELLGIPFIFNGATYAFGVIGSSSWFGLAAGKVSDVADSTQVAEAVTDASLGHGQTDAPTSEVASLATNGANSESHPPVGDGPDAQMMLVDLSGALNAWLTENLKNGTLSFVKPSSNLSELDAQATLVVVGPRPELFRQLNIPQRVVAKSANAREGETASIE